MSVLFTGRASERGSELDTKVAEILNRHPAIGLAVGVVRDGRLEFFHGHGLADIASGSPITEDTVFRIGSITKTFTAIAVMQLWEQGSIDLDAPADPYLCAYRLIPAHPTHRPVTVRHLLTYTAGLPQCVYLSRAFKPTLGEMVPFGRPVPTLDRYYRGGLRLIAEPGTRHVYSNHGFATLGQIIEDVTAQPLHSYFREHIFEPLGMESTDLVRSDRVRGSLATAYVLRSHGACPVGDQDLITFAGGGVYSTTRDVARYVAALLGGGTNELGSILRPETLEAMFASQYRPDPHLAGVGLAFYRREVGGHLFIEKSGLVPGFASQMSLAPDDGVGVVAFTNGSRGAHGWLGPEVSRILCRSVGAPDEALRTDVPQRPEMWSDLCGRYALRGSWRDAQKWLIAGANIVVRGGRLVLRPVTPIPGLRGFPLYPDDEEDPYVFRVDLSRLGIGTVRVVFSAEREHPRRPSMSRSSPSCRSTSGLRPRIRSCGRSVRPRWVRRPRWLGASPGEREHRHDRPLRARARPCLVRVAARSARAHGRSLADRRRVAGGTQDGTAVSVRCGSSASAARQATGSRHVRASANPDESTSRRAIPDFAKEATMTTIRIRDVDLNVKVTGHGYPLGLMHGGPSGDLYSLLSFRQCKDQFTLVFYDHRCNGRSTGVPVTSMTWENLTADADALRERLGFERWAVLGHSFGGNVALEYALRYPSRVSHLVLLDTGAEGRWSLENASKVLAERGYSPDIVDLAKRWLNGEVPPKESFRTLMKLGNAYNPHSGMGLLARMALEGAWRSKLRPEALIFGAHHLLPGWSVIDRLGEIEVPTLVMAGKDDFIYPPEHQAELAAHIPNSRLRLIERAGHNPHDEQTAEVMKELRAFIPADIGARAGSAHARGTRAE